MAQFLLDSESSKTSDFKRMHTDEWYRRPAHHDGHASNTATVKGVQYSHLQRGVLNISREAIVKWNVRR